MCFSEWLQARFATPGSIGGFAGEEPRTVHAAAKKLARRHGVPIMEVGGQRAKNFSVENPAQGCERLGNDSRPIQADSRLGSGPRAPAGQQR